MHNRTIALELIYLQLAADALLLADSEIYFVMVKTLYDTFIKMR